MKKLVSILLTLALAVSLFVMPAVVSANPGGVELVDIGDSTAEWTTEEKYVGDYSAKLSMRGGWWDSPNNNAEVQISITGNPKISEIDSWSFWTLTLTGQESYAVPIEFYADIDGDGVADEIIAGNILKASVPVTDEWYQMTPELWETGGAFYVWREDGTGFDWANTWAEAVERWGDATLLRVDLGYGHLGSTKAIDAYVDDFTLTVNGTPTTYELEPPPPEHTITFDTDPDATGSITFDGVSYNDGDTVSKTATTYNIVAGPASGYTFDSWQTTGALSVTAASSATTTCEVSGDGTLRMVQTTAPGPSPAVGGTAYPENTLGILAPWLAIAVAIIAGVALLIRRRRAQS